MSVSGNFNTPESDKTITQCNEQLLSQQVPVHYDSRKPSLLATDASPVVVRAVSIITYAELGHIGR